MFFAPVVGVCLADGTAADTTNGVISAAAWTHTATPRIGGKNTIMPCVAVVTNLTDDIACATITDVATGVEGMVSEESSDHEAGADATAFPPGLLVDTWFTNPVILDWIIVANTAVCGE